MVNGSIIAQSANRRGINRVNNFDGGLHDKEIERLNNSEVRQALKNVI